MPINTQRDDYKAAQSWWQRCRDVYAGSDAVKARRQTYLPKLTGQDDTEYNAYLTRALFYNAMDRTVFGLAGSVFSKEPSVHCPEMCKEHMKDITLSGTDMATFALGLFMELLKVGRGGVLVDMAVRDPKSPQTFEERPYWAFYATEQIIAYDTVYRGGQRILTRVVLKEETIEPDPKDPYVQVKKPRYRELYLDEGGKYQVQLWVTQGENKEVFIKGDLVTPMKRGATLDFIPFVFFGPTGTDVEICKPPLLDLVDVNLSHFRSSADLEHGRHFCGLPTPWTAGAIANNGGPLTIGSGVAWQFQDANGKAGMLEFTGQGLKALEEALRSKEALMAVLGARLLEEKSRVQEAAETVRMRHAGESSVLQMMAEAVSAGLTRCMKWHCSWSGTEDPDVDVTLNDEFFDQKMSAQEMQALVAMWQAEAISYETFYHNLQKGGVARPGVDFAAEREAINADALEDQTEDDLEDDDDIDGMDVEVLDEEGKPVPPTDPRHALLMAQQKAPAGPQAGRKPGEGGPKGAVPGSSGGQRGERGKPPVGKPSPGGPKPPQKAVK